MLEREQLYRVWSRLRSRCNNPKVRSYKNYGGRGITVCKRWDDFNTFLSDMGPRPAGYSIDRIDNNGNYEPSNCRWATMRDQNNNRRDNRVVEFRGEKMTLRRAVELSGFKAGHKTIESRLKRGWGLEEALTQPLLPAGERKRFGRARKAAPSSLSGDERNG
jgi:hypothetical protein